MAAVPGNEARGMYWLHVMECLVCHREEYKMSLPCSSKEGRVI